MPRLMRTSLTELSRRTSIKNHPGFDRRKASRTRFVPPYAWSLRSSPAIFDILSCFAWRDREIRTICNSIARNDCLSRRKLVLAVEEVPSADYLSIVWKYLTESMCQEVC